MLDLAPALCDLLDRGHRVAVATLVAVDGSAPRALGAAMALTGDGQVLGSISGGCVESELVEAARAVLAGGPARVRQFGAGDLVEPGLTCGGTITVLVSDLSSLGEEGLHQLRRSAAGLDAVLPLAADGSSCTDEPLVVLRTARRPELVVVGAVEFGVALCRLGAASGFRVTVVDPREVFATKERFPDAHAVVVDWPGRWFAARAWSADDAVCVLSHDPKVDLPSLEHALRSPAGFVGAMGSRRTHENRVAGLRERGVTDDELSRLRSPIGLDLGASTPEQTAVSILAEILTVRNGRSGRPLSQLSTRIH
ncbi:XdhC/CoxI family protein [Aeromicrobium alkaliterrae]|uniref:XdhC family protein n=1 Tax=Aeromicrobium alkaliterrae TaxID=302168 RepID=UPI0031E19C06